jgi:hypothetical protein
MTLDVKLDSVYVNPEPITITEAMKNAARDFAEKMTGTGQSIEYYREKRNAMKSDKDTYTAKLAEQLGDLFMQTQCSFPAAKLDWSIWVGTEKGWVPDLQYPPGLPHGHVKSTTRQWGGDYSWSFQFGDKTPGGTDRLFYLVDGFDRERFFRERHSPNHGTTAAPDFIVFVRLETAPDPRAGWVMAVVRWRTIIERVPFVDPTLPYLKGLKLYVNNNDIIKALNAARE